MNGKSNVVKGQMDEGLVMLVKASSKYSGVILTTFSNLDKK